MFSPSEGQRQQTPKHTVSTADGSQHSGPTAVALAAAAPADAAVPGTRVFPAVSSKGVAEAPASSAGAASAAVPAAAPATSGTVTSAASIRGAVGARKSSAGAVSSDAAVEAAMSTGGTAAPVASVARAARALASMAGSAGDSWAWAISQGCLRFYPRRRVSVRRLTPRPRPIPTALSFLHARAVLWRRRARTRRRTRDLIARFGGGRRTWSSTACARLSHSRSWGAHSNEGSTLSRPSGCILGRVTSLAM